MRMLNITTDNFDTVNSFEIAVQSKRTGLQSRIRCQLRQTSDGMLWALNTGSCIKSHYTVEDRAEQARLAAETPIADGDLVVIEGREYRIKVNGAYSDAAVFTPVQ